MKESWCREKRSNENVVSYILLMRERLEKMRQEAHTNMLGACTRQKTWYDKGARERSFQPGDQVLVLLPTSSSKLTAQWHGPYRVDKRMGKVNYRITMHDRKKKQVVFHINMLQRWHKPTTAFSPKKWMMSKTAFHSGMMLTWVVLKWVSIWMEHKFRISLNYCNSLVMCFNRYPDIQV